MRYFRPCTQFKNYQSEAISRCVELRQQAPAISNPAPQLHQNLALIPLSPGSQLHLTMALNYIEPRPQLHLAQTLTTSSPDPNYIQPRPKLRPAQTPTTSSSGLRRHPTQATTTSILDPEQIPDNSECCIPIIFNNGCREI